MNIQAFIDESGGKGQSKVFTLAGWLSTRERWLDFSKDWRACLNSHPQLNCFKMREAASRVGPFHGVPPHVRDGKLRALAAIVRKHATIAFHCTLDLEGFADTIAQLEKPFSDPYFWPFQITMMALCLDLVERGCSSQMEVVFDEHSIFRPRAVPWYPLVRTFMNNPAEIAVMPPWPLFSTDAESPPLQAADMLAWLMRRSMNKHWGVIDEWEPTGELGYCPPDPPNYFGWLVEEELRFVEMSPHSQFLTKQRLVGITDLMNDYLRNGFKNAPIPPGLDQLFRDLLAQDPAIARRLRRR